MAGSADLQICHRYSNLSAHSNRQDRPTQGPSVRNGHDAKERPVEIDVRTQDQVKVIKLRGKLNLGAALDRTNETIKDLLDSGESRLLLDLQEVPMIDSSGIGLLVRYLTAAKQRGGSLKLLNPSKFALQTLKLVRVVNLFEIFEDQQAAVSSFQ
jgi:anti-sigma B factor antagonist